MRTPLLLAGLALLLPAAPAAALGDCATQPLPGLTVCSVDFGFFKETTVAYDDPAVARAGFHSIYFEGFAGPDTTYEAFAFTGRDSPVGENGAWVGYRCLQFNGAPECTLLVAGVSASLAGLGGPTQFAGYKRDLFAAGGWCLEGDLANQCSGAPWPLRPLPPL